MPTGCEKFDLKEERTTLFPHIEHKVMDNYKQKSGLSPLGSMGLKKKKIECLANPGHIY